MTKIFKNPISKKYSRSYIELAQGLVRSDKNKRFFKIALTSCKDLEKNLNKKILSDLTNILYKDL